MIVVVGLSHQSAPIAVRERLAVTREQLPELLHRVLASDCVAEAMLISTCNRVELLAVAADSSGECLGRAGRAVESVLLARSPDARRFLYRHEAAAAVRHLFRVAASLDSLVVGEPQILGQVKDAYELGRRFGTVGPILHRLLSRALRAAKRARSQTAVGAGQVSVPSVALDLAESIFGDLAGRRAMLIGSGEMAETIAKLCCGAGAELVVVGRNADRVVEVASRFDAEGRGWEALDASLIEADLVISSTSAPHYVVDAKRIDGVRRQRRGRSLFFIDVAVPRDIDPHLNEFDGVFVYNVDDLSHVVAESMSGRRREADRAEAIVSEEAQGYERWLGAEQVTPTIRRLRQHFSEIAGCELERSLRAKLKHLGTEDRVALQRMLDAAIKKVLHAPSVRLRQATFEVSEEGQSADALVQALHQLFAFDEAPLSLATEASSPPDGSDVAPLSDSAELVSLKAGSR